MYFVVVFTQGVSCVIFCGFKLLYYFKALAWHICQQVSVALFYFPSTPRIYSKTVFVCLQSFLLMQANYLATYKGQATTALFYKINGWSMFWGPLTTFKTRADI